MTSTDALSVARFTEAETTGAATRECCGPRQRRTRRTCPAKGSGENKCMKGSVSSGMLYCYCNGGCDSRMLRTAAAQDPQDMPWKGESSARDKSVMKG